jgi:hypothetical protein
MVDLSGPGWQLEEWVAQLIVHLQEAVSASNLVAVLANHLRGNAMAGRRSLLFHAQHHPFYKEWSRMNP